MRTFIVNLAVDPDDVQKIVLLLSRIEGVDFIQPGGDRKSPWHRLVQTLESQVEKTRKLLELLELQPGQKSSSPVDINPEKDTREAEKLIAELEKRVIRTEDEIKLNQNKVEKLQKVSENIKWLDSINISMDRILDLKYIELRFGWIPSTQKGRVSLPILEIPVVILFFSEFRERTLIAAVTEKKDGFVLDRMLKALFFDPLDTPDIEEISEKMLSGIKDSEDQINEFKRNLSELKKEREQIRVEYGDRLVAISSRLKSDLDAVKLIERYCRPGNQYFLRFGISEDNMENFKTAVEKELENPYAVYASIAPETVERT